MFNRIIGRMVLLTTVFALYLDLSESECTTRLCGQHDEANLFALFMRNQEVVEQLQHELSALRSKAELNEDVVGSLQQELRTINTKAEHNQDVVGRLQQEVTEFKKELAIQVGLNSKTEGEVQQLQLEVSELKEELAREQCRLGTSRRNAARSCKHIFTNAPDAANGIYWICVSPSCKDARQLFCDMRNSGWTLIGQIGGVAGNLYEKWLTTNVNTYVLRRPTIKRGTYGCIDAIDLAVNHANQIRLSSGENNTGMGQFWVEWDLPADRNVSTFWKLSVGSSVVDSAPEHKVEVRSSFAPKRICYQNKYGIQTFGTFPATVMSTDIIVPNNVCMAVVVLYPGTSVWGFTENGNGYDAPTSDLDWPNVETGPPFVSVWLR